MLHLLLQALAAVASVLVLGYYAGRKQLISQAGARDFSTYIVTFALPCTLFVGILNFKSAQFENVPYLLTLTIALVLPFIIGAGFGLLFFKKSVAESGLFGCNSGFPDSAYIGLPVLVTVVGAQALLPVIVSNLVTSLLIVPTILYMLHHGRPETDGGESASLLSNVLETIKQPMVWAPVLGLVLVLADVTLPSLVKAPLKLIGDSTGGTALFTLGILLSRLKPQVDLGTVVVVFLKNLVAPAIALGLALLFRLDAPLAKGAIIAAACPAATIGAMFSAKFQVGQNTIPAEILASNVFGIASMAFWIFVAEHMG
jgi:malonate transporter